ncbi:MAG: hypothetical protein QOF26_3127 [Baekduia sp.]|jgi:hypothetical protein|nr:hypothetical protein [Baekduia sp.]MDX6702901.1 hypothetical protein [Baekduia sp.]
MSLLALVSSTAIVIGLCAALPQLAAMVRARSAAGQSALGWSLGAFVNGLMSYVNFAGYHATVLALGNVASLVLCLVAIALVARFGTGEAEAVDGRRQATVSDLPTHEFWALREQLEHEAARRGQPVLVAA